MILIYLKYYIHIYKYNLIVYFYLIIENINININQKYLKIVLKYKNIVIASFCELFTYNDKSHKKRNILKFNIYFIEIIVE